MNKSLNLIMNAKLHISPLLLAAVIANAAPVKPVVSDNPQVMLWSTPNLRMNLQANCEVVHEVMYSIVCSDTLVFSVWSNYPNVTLEDVKLGGESISNNNSGWGSFSIPVGKPDHFALTATLRGDWEHSQIRVEEVILEIKQSDIDEAIKKAKTDYSMNERVREENRAIVFFWIGFIAALVAGFYALRVIYKRGKQRAYKSMEKIVEINDRIVLHNEKVREEARASLKQKAPDSPRDQL